MKYFTIAIVIYFINLPLFRLFYLYIIVITTERVFDRKECETMNKKQELIDRIKNLSPEQFELLITLYSQQEQESVLSVQVEPQTSPPLAL